MNLPNFSEEQKLWNNGYTLVIGVDEVGRGAFAGPLVASAVALVPQISNFQFPISNEITIDDSKRLKPREREKAGVWIKENCLAFGIGEVGVATINKMGIGRATTQAMRLAIGQVLRKLPNHLSKTFVLVDAFHIEYLRGVGFKNQKAIIKGDQKSISIAAASIIAKVYRDSLMQRLSKRHSKYRWGVNKGYGTKVHQDAIRAHGITRLHRVQFVQTFLASQGLALQG